MKNESLDDSSSIPDDLNLLHSMMKDSDSAPNKYRPGPYWASKAKTAAKNIVKFGLKDFRGSTNCIGASFTDNGIVDTRHAYKTGMRAPLGFLLEKVFPFSRAFDSQVRLTTSYLKAAVELRNQLNNKSERVAHLLERYRLPIDTIRGGCQDFCEIDGRKIANHYLSLLSTHDALARHVDFSSANSFFEIGGGFGVNIHILIENYKNLRKFVYLDIPPNLYVGTQYLKSFYGDCIVPYSKTRNLNSIAFSPDDGLEVFCIAPQQIEQLDIQIDVFQNSHSFVEMPVAVVKNYADHVEKLMNVNKSSIALVSYDLFDLGTTFHPDKLPDFFPRRFVRFEDEHLLDTHRKNYHYISNTACPSELP